MIITKKKYNDIFDKIELLEDKIVNLEKFLGLIFETFETSLHRYPKYSYYEHGLLKSFQERIEYLSDFQWKVENPAKFKKGDSVRLIIPPSSPSPFSEIPKDILSSEVYIIFDTNFVKDWNGCNQWNYILVDKEYNQVEVSEYQIKLSEKSFCKKEKK